MVEIDPALVALARENAASNGLAERTRAVQLDVEAAAAAFVAAELAPGGADHVLMNSPFNAAQILRPTAAAGSLTRLRMTRLAVSLRAAARLLAPRAP